MIKILYCFLFLAHLNVWSNSKNLERFFSATKSQDYEAAYKIVESLEESILKDRLVLLVTLMTEKRQSTIPNNLFEKTPDKTIDFLNALISGYYFQYASKQDNLKAYKYFSNAIKLSNEIENSEYIKAALIGMLGVFSDEIFIASKQYEPYLNEFIELKSDRVDEVLIIKYSLIFLTSDNQNFESSETQYYYFYNKLDSIFELVPKTHSFFPYYYFEKGIYYKLEEEYEKAEDFFLKADSTSLKYNHLGEFRQKVAWQIAHVKSLGNNLVEAKKYLQLAKKNSTKLKDTFYFTRLASFIYEKKGNYDSAFYNLRKSVDIEYELGYKNNTLETAILTVQNQTDKLKLDKLELASSNTKNRNLIILLAVLLGLGSVIAVLINKNSRRKQLLAEQEQTLEKQKVTSLLKEQELITIDAMVQGQEKERLRVANELHDDLGSLMAAVKLQFNSLEASDKKGNLATFAKTESLIDEAYGKIRAIAHAKNSGLIAKQGLLQAVNQMAEKVSVASNIQISVHDHGLDNRLENSLELTLFRIIQELMANVIKHAEATEMNIHITNHGDSLNIMAEDNGKGMVVNSGFIESEGMGLKSIDKRINHLNGTMNLESEIGKGTVIILDIPI
tara:strand:+ start:27997 stop:29850 length:1854 start_codon:yes stop_codon:yes gene_type:complete